MIPPGSTIGILGGGQLGRMTALAAAGSATRATSTAPTASPAKHVTAFSTTAAYEDRAALARFADAVDVVTFEFENVPADTAECLAELKPVRPGPRCCASAQDRLKEKNFLRSIEVATTEYREVRERGELARAARDWGCPRCSKRPATAMTARARSRSPATAISTRPGPRMGGRVGILEGFVDFAWRCP